MASAELITKSLHEAVGAPELAGEFGAYVRKATEFALAQEGQRFGELAANTTVPMLCATALFGKLLTLTSRTRLVELATEGNEEARLALRKLVGTRAVYPGTFDPFTLGHKDVATRAATLFDEVIIGIGVNPKKAPLFSVEERTAQIKEELQDIAGSIRVTHYEGATITFARSVESRVLLRGIRSVSDYLYELDMALVNLELSGGEIETLFIPSQAGSSFYSSGNVREAMRLDLNPSRMVSPRILAALREKRANGELR